MPDTMPQMVVPKVARAVSHTTVQATRTYVRDVSAGGIGTGSGNGIGLGSGPGSAPASAALSASSGARGSTSCW